MALTRRTVCAIVDTNVVPEVFGEVRPPAGEGFFKWLDSGDGRLVTGGKLLDEMRQNTRSSSWVASARRTGRARILNAEEVRAATAAVEAQGGYISDDPHVLAIAQISGARLLYTNDTDLQRDFDNRELIRDPRGKVYSTLVETTFEKDRRDFLAGPSVENESCARYFRDLR